MSKVVVHVYDLTGGLARQMSMGFLGKQIDGVWHTGVVVFGKEYFFGGGIQSLSPGLTPYGRPVEVVDLGETQIPQELFEDFLIEISPRYTMATYDLFENNCNNFSQEVAFFLTGQSLPQHIVSLPTEIINSPMGPLIRSMMDRFAGGAAGGMPGSFGGQGMFPMALPTQPARPAAPQAASTTPPTNPTPSTTTSGTGAAAAAAAAAASASQVAADNAAHESFRALSLPVLESHSRPLLAPQPGDGAAAAAAEKLREAWEAHWKQKGAAAPAEEQAGVEGLAAHLAADPAARGGPDRGVYRVLARVLSEMPVRAWGPGLDVLRLLLLAPAPNAHYAASAGGAVLVILRRCIAAPDTPGPVATRAVFAVTNMFAHPPGAERVGRGEEAKAWVEATLALLDSPFAPARLAAAALAYNLALALPRQTGADAAQELRVLVDGLTRRAGRGVSGALVGAGEAGGPLLEGIVRLRVLLALGRAVRASRAAAVLLRSLVADVSLLAGGEEDQAEKRKAIAGELALMVGSLG